jgi:hypothetical protein
MRVIMCSCRKKANERTKCIALTNIAAGSQGEMKAKAKSEA